MFAQISSLPSNVAWFLALWMFCLGACVGSFLNVVIYRLPAGLPLARPNSRCPQCLHPIRWFDNLPLLSWLLLLRARCRDCRAPIPPRYPLVELLVGAVFFLFGVVQGLEGGSNLPARFPLETAPASPWLAVGYHLLLIATLISAAFVQYDGHRPPLRLFAPAFVCGLAGPAIWQDLRPIGIAATDWPLLAAGAFESLGGLAVGAGMGWLSSGFRHRGGAADARTPVVLAALVGLMLGWQAIVILSAATAIVWMLRLLLSDTTLALAPWSGWLTATVIVLLANWRWLSDTFPAMVRDLSLPGVAAAGLLIAAVRLIDRLYAATQPTAEQAAS